jgi:ATP-dependent RNA helicase DeaD
MSNTATHLDHTDSSVASTIDTTELTGFASLGMDVRLLSALTALGYEEPTPIQMAAIPPLLAGRDVLAMAATGTGKTAAFALPLLHKLNPNARAAERTAGLVLVPTRELAMQVAEAVHRYGKPLGITALAIYGGAPMEPQLKALKRGVDVVIATPGRALDHLRRKSLSLAHIKVVVLDEADEMLDMGFADDLEAILENTPPDRQTALFSATLPPRINSIANGHLTDPVRVRIDREIVADGATARVRQVAYVVTRNHKMAALGRVLDVESPTAAIVFCRTRTEVDELNETLTARGLRAEALHGGLSQDQRDRVMKRFRAKKTDLLIATDVAARGLDVDHVSHVVNFDVPSDAEAYVHRIGRTGRAGRTGIAITLAEPREHRLLRNIERLTGQPISIEAVPTVSDLRARRLELTRSALRDAILETAKTGGDEAGHEVIASLAEEFDIFDIAAAAVRLLDAGRQGTEEPEIPVASVRPERTSSYSGSAPGGARSFPARTSRGERPERSESGGGRSDRSSSSRGERQTGAAGRIAASGEGAAAKRAPAKPRAPSAGGSLTKLFIGGGRKAKIRPGDLVGAIVNETGVAAADIGAIVISDRHSTVEVPSAKADQIVQALGAAHIKGKKVPVRRDRVG